MPTATPFTALGRDNGLSNFSSCLTRIDVDDYFMWTTLSGHSSGLASEASINQSLILAHKLHYNIYSVDGEAFAASGIGDITIQEFAVGGVFSDDLPHERVCKQIINQNFDGTISNRSARMAFRLLIVRLYLGGTFVGYGAATSAISSKARIPFIQAGVSLSGTQQTELPDTDRFTREFARVTLGGAHFICSAFTECIFTSEIPNLREFTTDLSASGMTAAIELKRRGNENNPYTIHQANAEFTGMEFYTYT